MAGGCLKNQRENNVRCIPIKLHKKSVKRSSQQLNGISKWPSSPPLIDSMSKSKHALLHLQTEYVFSRIFVRRIVRLKRETYSCYFSLIFTIYLRKILNQKGFDAWNQCYFT